MNEQADQPATPGNQPGIPGKTLQSQREAMGWSVEQVADQLKLAPRQVVALEAGDYAALPSPAVTRGFVRAYAKLLKIDAAPLVSMIELNMPPEAQAGAPINAGAVRREQRPATFSETRFPMGGKRNRLPLGWIAAAVVVAGAAVAAWQFDLIPNLQRDGQAGDATVLENPAAGVVAPGSAPAHAAPQGLINPSVPLISVPAPAGESAPPAAAPGSTPGAAPATPTAPVPAVPPPAGAPAPAAGTPTAAAPGATPAPTVSTAAAPVTAVAPTAGANTLVLNVREDSWIEVRPSAGGRPLISRLVKGGSTESVELSGPATLVVGAPGGVSATLRGADVALPQQPGRTIARVALK
jgi:cytoskeleton protein RodZ